MPTAKTAQRTGNAHPNIYPYNSLNTGTQPVSFAVGNDRQFQRMSKHLGAPELASDERYATAGARSSNRVALKAALEQQLVRFDGQQLAEDLVRIGVPAAVVLTVPQALQHAHTQHREMVVEMPGGYRGVGAPVKLSRTPASYRHAPLSEGEAFLPRDENG